MIGIRLVFAAGVKPLSKIGRPSSSKAADGPDRFALSPGAVARHMLLLGLVASSTVEGDKNVSEKSRLVLEERVALQASQMERMCTQRSWSWRSGMRPGLLRSISSKRPAVALSPLSTQSGDDAHRHPIPSASMPTASRTPTCTLPVAAVLTFADATGEGALCWE